MRQPPKSAKANSKVSEAEFLSGVWFSSNRHGPTLVLDAVKQGNFPPCGQSPKSLGFSPSRGFFLGRRVRETDSG
jgi:hypothetical protein